MAAIDDETPDACERCPTEFLCTQLMTALTILEPRIKKSANEELLAEWDEVAALLQRMEWKSPKGARFCHLHDKPEEIRELTERIIRLSEKLDGRVPHPLVKSDLYRTLYKKTGDEP